MGGGGCWAGLMSQGSRKMTGTGSGDTLDQTSSSSQSGGPQSRSRPSIGVRSRTRAAEVVAAPSAQFSAVSTSQPADDVDGQVISTCTEGKPKLREDGECGPCHSAGKHQSQA